MTKDMRMESWKPGPEPSPTPFPDNYVSLQESEIRSALQAFWPDWHVEGEIGRGTYGIVYKVSRDIPTRSCRAVKMIEVGRIRSFSKQTRASYYQDLRNRMIGEIEVMESLTGLSPYILTIEDSHICDRSDGEGFVIGFRMELLESLVDHFDQMETITVSDSVRAVIDVCKALVLCHERGIIHRDVKPDNIFWCERTGNYKLGDFGVAKQLDDDARSRASSIAGTESYIAPEVFARINGGIGSYTSNVDVYSLGMVLFRLLNDDRHPFDDDQRRLGGEILPNPMNGDDYLADLIRSACNPNPSYRLQNSQAFLNALENWPGLER